MHADTTKSSSFRGVYAATLTPLHEDLSCNEEALASHCKDLIDRGCQGIVLFGTTGEGTSFSVAERTKILKNLLKLGMDPQRLILGVSCCAIDDAVQLSCLAVEYHCLAVLMAPPFFYKNICEEGVIAFYREVVQKVAHRDLKILLYHIPQYSGVAITLNVIKALCTEFVHQVIGMKESEGNFPLTQAILSTFPDFYLFVGNELHISQAVQQGAVGAISGIANGYPELICSLYQHPQKSPPISAIVETLSQYPLFPAIKSIVEKQKGSAWHTLRPPLTPLNQQEYQLLHQKLGRLNTFTGEIYEKL